MYLVIDTSTHKRRGWPVARRRPRADDRLEHAQQPHRRAHAGSPRAAGCGACCAGRPDWRDCRTRPPGGSVRCERVSPWRKGLAFAVSAPLAGVSTLEATAYAFRGAGLPVCPLISAGRDLVAWARFQQTDEGWARRAPDRVTPVGRLLAARGRHALFCGEGAHNYAEELRAAMGARAHIVEPGGPGLRIEGLAALGAARLRQRRTTTTSRRFGRTTYGPPPSAGLRRRGNDRRAASTTRGERARATNEEGLCSPVA